MSSRREYGSVEEYLERLRGLLIGLPQVEIDGAIEEMGPHLLTLVDSERCAGLSEADAVRNAIAKFGEPQVIARKELLGYVNRLDESNMSRSQSGKQAWKFWTVYLLAIAATTAVLIGLMSWINMPSWVALTTSGLVSGIVSGVSLAIMNSQKSDEGIRALLGNLTEEQKQSIISSLDEYDPAKKIQSGARLGLRQKIKNWRSRIWLNFVRRMATTGLSGVAKRPKPIRLLWDMLQFPICYGIVALIFPSLRASHFFFTMMAFIITMTISQWATQQVIYARNAKRKLSR